MAPISIGTPPRLSSARARCGPLSCSLARFPATSRTSAVTCWFVQASIGAPVMATNAPVGHLTRWRFRCAPPTDGEPHCRPANSRAAFAVGQWRLRTSSQVGTVTARDRAICLLERTRDARICIRWHPGFDDGKCRCKSSGSCCAREPYIGRVCYHNCKAPQHPLLGKPQWIMYPARGTSRRNA